VAESRPSDRAHSRIRTRVQLVLARASARQYACTLTRGSRRGRIYFRRCRCVQTHHPLDLSPSLSLPLSQRGNRSHSEEAAHTGAFIRVVYSFAGSAERSESAEMPPKNQRQATSALVVRVISSLYRRDEIARDRGSRIADRGSLRGIVTIAPATYEARSVKRKRYADVEKATSRVLIMRARGSALHS